MSDTKQQDRTIEPAPTAGPRMGRGGSAAIGGANPKNAGHAAARIWQLLGRNRKVLVVSVLLSIGSVLASTLGPWQLGKATDLLIGEAYSHAGLIRQLLQVAGLYLASAALNLGQAWLINDLMLTTGRRLRRQAQAKLSRVPLSWFDAQPHGEVLSRFTNDIDNMIQSLQQVASQALLSLLTIIAVLAVMVVLSPTLALVAITAIALSLGITRLIARAARPQFKAQWRETGHLNSTVEESFTGQTLIRVFGARARIGDHFDIQNATLTRVGMTGQILASLIQPVTIFVNNLAYIAVVSVGGFRVLSGELTLGELQAFIQYIRQIGQPGRARPRW
ncbi:ABC transporter ATP-binding protein [Pseudophaeobacter sp.]|uniref:ABC transporter permease n=1 Tax=Pseudophaeobacter sp. TaxID=1971739 RepID=UPI003298B224